MVGQPLGAGRACCAGSSRRRWCAAAIVTFGECVSCPDGIRRADAVGRPCRRSWLSLRQAASRRAPPARRTTMTRAPWASRRERGRECRPDHRPRRAHRNGHSVARKLSGIGEGRRAPEPPAMARIFGLCKGAVPGRFRPHERLVVEAGGKERREHVVDERRSRDRARASGSGSSPEGRHSSWTLGGAQIGGEARARPHCHEGVGLVRPGRHDAARAVIFERTSDEMHAVGEQGGSERVAGEAFVSLAVERKAQLPCPVDAPPCVEANRQST